MKNVSCLVIYVALGLLLSGCSSPKSTSTEKEEPALHQRVAQQALDVKTKARLKNLGLTYRMAAIGGRSPRSFNELLEHTEKQPGMFQSARDKQDFEVAWGVRLDSIQESGTTLLAWEKTAAPDGGRCVLMADCSTVQYLNKEDFDKAPRAKGR